MNIKLIDFICFSQIGHHINQDVMSHAVHLKLILYMFEAISGPKINFSKSEVIMVLEDNKKGLMYDDMFGCQLGVWPIKYLGVPVCGSRLDVAYLVLVSDKLKKKLDGWVGNTSLIGGRLILIQSSLSGISIYLMSMYFLPKTKIWGS